MTTKINLQEKLNTLWNTRKYKRKTDDIDKEIELLIAQIENCEKTIVNTINDVVVDIVEDSIIKQVAQIKNIVDSVVKPKGRPAKKFDKY